MISDSSALVGAIANNSSRLMIEKGYTTLFANGIASLWRTSGVPGVGAIPGAASACTKALAGAFGFPGQTSPAKSYIAWASLHNSNSAMCVEVHDRLAHIGGISTNSTASQAAVLDPAALGVSADRLGPAKLSDVQWWYEVYVTHTNTASNITVNVVYDDNSTGALAVFAGAALNVSRAIHLNPLIPNGRFIKSISSVQLSVAIAAGSFGFTATRLKTALPLNLAWKAETFDWAQIGLPDVANDACLQLFTVNTVATAGTLRGTLKLAHG